MDERPWLVKVRRNGGGESVVSRWSHRADAEEDVGFRNADIQSDNYYVEQYDPTKALTFIEPGGTE